MRSLWIVIASVALLLGQPLRAEEPTQKQLAIRKLIELTGAAQMGKQVSDALMTQLAPAFPSVPPELWKELGTLVDPGELTDLTIPLYDKHFSLEEIQALAAFYDSPAGRKFIATMPALMEESLEVGNRWGREKAEELLRRLKEKGYEPVKA